VLPGTSKLTEHYQSGDDGLTKCVRLFRYFYKLLRKSLLKLDNGKFVTAFTQWDVTGKKYFDFRRSLKHFGALISDEDFDQVSLKSDKSTYPINSFE